MGCDIHTITEKRKDGKWQAVLIHPQAFDYRNYGLFGFLADVRNYSSIPPVTTRRGYPDDTTPQTIKMRDYWDLDGHSPTWVTLKELLDFDYDKVFKDRRCSVTIGNYTNGVALCPEDIAKVRTYREFLGEWYFKELRRLEYVTENPADLRIVMCFDN